MKRIFRNDFYINDENDVLEIVSKKNNNIVFPINQAHAVYLSLFNGLYDDREIGQIVSELFGDDISKFASVNRFLMPVEYAFLAFGRYIHPYSPEDFLKKKYKLPVDSGQDIVIPRYMTLCLTHMCYRKCLYCYAQAEKSKNIEYNALDMSDYKRLLLEAFDLAIEGVLLTGGEPLMHPYAYDIIEFLCSHGIKTQVLTKYPINEKRLLFIDTRFLDLCLSIDTYEPTMANYLTSSTSFFDDMRQNIIILNKNNIAFNATIVITKLNILQVINTIMFLLNSGAKHVFTNYYSYDKVKVDELVLSEEEKNDFDQKIKEFIRTSKLSGYVTHNVSISTNDILKMRCDGLFRKVSIDYNGKYLICDHARDVYTGFKDIQNQTILEHYNSELINMYRYPSREKYNGTNCEKCELFEKCIAKNSCYAKSYARYNNLFRPLKEVDDVCDKR